MKKVKPFNLFGLDANVICLLQVIVEEKSRMKKGCFQPAVLGCLALRHLWIKAVGQRHQLLLVYMLQAPEFNSSLLG